VAEPGRHAAAVPRYERVKRHILAGIRKGRWREGDRLPSEHELRAALGVARMTVNRALRELADAGQVRRVQGAGSFVARPPRRSPLIEIRDIAEDIAARGLRHSVRVLKHERVRADATLAVAFQLRSGATLFHSLLLHLEDGIPLQIEERYVTPAFAPRYLDQDFTRVTPSHYLRSIAPATEVEHTVNAVLPDARSARLLGVGPGEPCLRLARQTWVGRQPATRGTFTYPGARYSLGSRYPLGTARGTP
jgi:GntR family histidine utilization transcriptional repressor